MSEIKIPREWLERLIRYAERIEKDFKKNNKILVVANLPSLFGYISSAKTILKNNK